MGMNQSSSPPSSSIFALLRREGLLLSVNQASNSAQKTIFSYFESEFEVFKEGIQICELWRVTAKFVIKLGFALRALHLSHNPPNIVQTQNQSRKGTDRS
ncbi:hypothetical protein L6164_037511 [Bauhinia variegata]|uniref:Uncharacterized protein n=1 Tax=Bauhinia variegata TaxID=167791 RepID=A0ACB9KL04_BAUVA|nr:hypothetical protein L6164_037511 [Bauhinia variegata]